VNISPRSGLNISERKKARPHHILREEPIIQIRRHKTRYQTKMPIVPLVRKYKFLFRKETVDQVSELNTIKKLVIRCLNPLFNSNIEKVMTSFLLTSLLK
jgi:hypothetical protein